MKIHHLLGFLVEFGCPALYARLVVCTRTRQRRGPTAIFATGGILRYSIVGEWWRF